MNAKKVISVFLILGSTLTCISLSATANPAIPAEGTMQRKLVRGFSNVGLGSLEVLYQIDHKPVGIFAGWMPGLCIGIGRTVAREVTGFYEILTSPFFTNPVINPEFVLDSPYKKPV